MGALQGLFPANWVKSRKRLQAHLKFMTAGLRGLILRMAGGSPKVQLVLLVGSGYADA